jgi:signal peptidase
VWFSNPWVLGSLTLALTALVTWAFWPRARHLAHDGSPLAPAPHEGAAKHEATHHHGAGQHEAEHHAIAHRDHDAAHHDGPPHHGAGHTAQVILLIGAVAASTLLTAVPAARAVETDTIVSGTYITLTSVTDPEEFANMSPGKTVQWQVGVSVAAPKPGTVTLATSATGSAAMGLTAQARWCATRWVAGVCTGGGTLLQATQPIPLDGTDRTLATMSSSQVRWFMFDVTMPPTSTGVPAGESVSMLFRATGVEDDVTVGPGRLAATGTNGPTPWPAALAALGAIGVGLGIAGLASARRRRES